MAKTTSRIPQLLKGQDLLQDWIHEIKSSSAGGDGRISDSELQSQARDLLRLLQHASEHGDLTNINGPEWTPIREFLDSLSRSRVTQGFSSDQTATFVFSLKKPLFTRLQNAAAGDAKVLTADIWEASQLVDQLGLHTIKSFQKSREAVIIRQQEEMLELSTPVVKLWEGVLALPMIGTLDSARTQIVMESLLQRIVETGSEIAIIDITGVPMVDTLVAQHLLKTVTAIRLMGADCIISGVRPQIAQTIVHLGVDLQGVITKANLADALALALKRQVSQSLAPRFDLHAEQQMERIPILRMGEFLLVTIQVDMHDRLAMTLQDDLTNMIERTLAKGVLIDISALEMVDSFIGRMIANISGMSRILDASTVLVGMQPAVAITLVELGLSLPGVQTALNVERGMERLRAAMARREPAMAVIKTQTLPVRTEQDIVLARQTVRKLAIECAFGLVDQTKMVTAASELARNAVIYGGGGELLCEVLADQPRTGLRLTFEDQGPGIPDLSLAMKDGWTSGSGMGLGLSGTKRLVNQFDIDSVVGRGTKVTVTRWK